MGVALAVWLAMTVLYDGLVLALSVSLDAWPLERPLVGLMLMNPVDVARVATCGFNGTRNVKFISAMAFGLKRLGKRPVS